MEDQSCPPQTHSRPWRIKVTHHKLIQDHGGLKLPRYRLIQNNLDHSYLAEAQYYDGLKKGN
jgi:hypothetical protein